MRIIIAILLFALPMFCFSQPGKKAFSPGKVEKKYYQYLPNVTGTVTMSTGLPDNSEWIFYNKNVGSVTIDPPSGSTWDVGSSPVLTAGQAITVKLDGTVVRIISRN